MAILAIQHLTHVLTSDSYMLFWTELICYLPEFKEWINNESDFAIPNEKELEKYVKFLNEYIIKVKYFELYMCVWVNKLAKVG